jgi:hypothetical protein
MIKVGIKSQIDKYLTMDGVLLIFFKLWQGFFSIATCAPCVQLKPHHPKRTWEEKQI